VRIRNVRHAGLRRLVEDDDARGINADWRKRVRNILTALIVAEDMDGVEGPPGWRIHQYDDGTWSIDVTGNYRVTFKIEDGVICDLDLKDPH
jgi:proteic killer suppression protein